MPEPIENYTPQTTLKGLKRKAFKIWGIVLFFVALWVFLLILAPVAKASGWIEISNSIYSFYSYLCHQMPSRSFHILDHQFAVCSRCFGVYFGLFFGFMIYPLIRSVENIEPLPRIWLFLSLIPMGIDWMLGFFDVWENTHASRFITGLILGVACAIYIIPAIVELGQLIGNKRQTKRLPN